jgi:hypothetical protein
MPLFQATDSNNSDIFIFNLDLSKGKYGSAW